MSAATSAAGNRGSTVIPSNLQSSGEKMTFIAAQRERLNILLSALDDEAQELQRTEALKAQQRGQQAARLNIDSTDDDNEPTQRPPSGLSMWSALSKSRSEADFEKIEAESGAEDDLAIRRRNVAGQGGWMPWNWAGGANPGTSSGVDQ